MTSDNEDTKIDSLLFIDQELIKQFICLCPIFKYLLNESTMDMCGCSKLFCKNCLVEYLKSHDNICIISGNKSSKEDKKERKETKDNRYVSDSYF